MSRGFLVDTNILSATGRPGFPLTLAEWLRESQSSLYTSSINIAELWFGVERLPIANKRRALEQWLRKIVKTMGDHILRFDGRTAAIWGKLQADLERQARKMPLEDSYVAVIAIRHNLTVAAQNTRHFNRSGVQVAASSKVFQ